MLSLYNLKSGICALNYLVTVYHRTDGDHESRYRKENLRKVFFSSGFTFLG